MNSTRDLAGDSPTAGTPQSTDRHLVTLLKLAAAADRSVHGLRGAMLTDAERATVGELDSAVREAWDLLGPQHRMAATRG